MNELDEIAMNRKHLKNCYICVTINKMKYSNLIKALRNQLLLTQEELAKQIGVSFATVNRWEGGRHEPTMRYRRLIRSLCKKAGIKEEDYL